MWCNLNSITQAGTIFCLQQGGVKGAVPKGTAPWALTLLGHKIALLLHNEAALRGSPRWPAGESLCEDSSRWPALRCPSMALSPVQCYLGYSTLLARIFHEG